MNSSSDLKKFANSCTSVLNFKRFSRSLEQFFLAVGQNNFGNTACKAEKIQKGNLGPFGVKIPTQLSFCEFAYTYISKQFFFLSLTIAKN